MAGGALHVQAGSAGTAAIGLQKRSSWAQRQRELAALQQAAWVAQGTLLPHQLATLTLSAGSLGVPLLTGCPARSRAGWAALGPSAASVLGGFGSRRAPGLLPRRMGGRTSTLPWQGGSLLCPPGWPLAAVGEAGQRGRSALQTRPPERPGPRRQQEQADLNSSLGKQAQATTGRECKAAHRLA